MEKKTTSFSNLAEKHDSALKDIVIDKLTGSILEGMKGRYNERFLSEPEDHDRLNPDSSVPVNWFPVTGNEFLHGDYDPSHRYGKEIGDLLVLKSFYYADPNLDSGYSFKASVCENAKGDLFVLFTSFELGKKFNLHLDMQPVVAGFGPVGDNFTLLNIKQTTKALVAFVHDHNEQRTEIQNHFEKSIRVFQEKFYEQFRAGDFLLVQKEFTPPWREDFFGK